MDVSILEITDGTTTIDLLTSGIIRKPGVKVTDWKPNIPDYKGGGSWSDSPIADGRIPVFGRRGNVVDSFAFSMNAASTDKLAVVMQELFRIIEKGNQYWLGSYSLEPVWIKAQSPCETNARYALVYRAAVPELGFPYSGGFLSRAASFMRDLTLVVEHGPWCSAPPTQPECIPANTLSPSHYAAYINMEGRYVNCGSDASFDNLADNAFTIDGWFQADLGDYGGAAGAASYLAEKGTSAVAGWYLGITSAIGLAGFVKTATISAYSTSGLDDYTADGLWHHIAMTFDDAGDRKIRLWKDGTEVASYATQTAGTGAIVADAAQNLIIGDEGVTLTSNFHGKVGWVRVSNNRRWTVAFTAPARCTVPATDANTLGVWGGGGLGVTLYSQEGTTLHNAAIVGAVPPIWGFDCDTDFGNERTCTYDNYVVAGWSPFQLTHAFINDVAPGTWSANLIGSALPYNLFPVAPAIGDCVYFGIEGSAPFSNVVFDNAAALAGLTLVWEEHQGAINANTWGAIAEQHNAPDTGASDFGYAGVHAFKWFHGAGWTVGNLFQIFAGTAPPITARWIRARITAYAAGNVSQQNRQLYTANRPWVDIEATDVPGDIPAQVRAVVTQDHGSHGASAGYFVFSDAILALRSYDRDNDFFQPIINLGNIGNAPYITTSVFLGVSTFTDRIQANVGNTLNYASPGGSISQPVVSVSIDADYVQYFTGTFRVFMRYYCVVPLIAGFAKIEIVSPYTFTGAEGALYLTYDGLGGPVTDYNMVDLGTITIPPRTAFGRKLEFYIHINDDSPVWPVYDLYDVILIPTDEMAIRVRYGTAMLSYSTGESLIVDDMTYPRDGMVSWIGQIDTDKFNRSANIVSQQPPILQSNRHQRLIVLPCYGRVTPNQSSYSQMARVKLAGLSRYIGLRGAR